MEINLRNPNLIMKLSRLGSFHQSKLSFLRSFLKEFKNWEYKRDLFNLSELGYGTAVYSLSKDNRTYSLICYANELNETEFLKTLAVLCMVLNIRFVDSSSASVILSLTF